MHQNSERIEQFSTEIAAMKLRDPATGLDRLLTRLGVAGLAAGAGFAVAAWFISHGTRNPLQQRDAIVLGLLGVTLALVGGALWLKSTLAGFLRFWMARLCYEQQAQADRLAAALAPADAGKGPSGATAATATDGRGGDPPAAASSPTGEASSGATTSGPDAAGPPSSPAGDASSPEGGEAATEDETVTTSGS